MILEKFDRQLDEFIGSLEDDLLKDHKAYKVKAIGLHIDPINGFIAAGNHLGEPLIDSELNIPDFTSPEIAVIDFPEWEKNYWEGDGCAQQIKGAPVVSSEDNDSEYVELFVEWAASRFFSHTSKPTWSFQRAFHCVHPVGAEPLIYWGPGLKPTRG